MLSSNEKLISGINKFIETNSIFWLLHHEHM